MNHNCQICLFPNVVSPYRETFAFEHPGEILVLVNDWHCAQLQLMYAKKSTQCMWAMSRFLVTTWLGKRNNR